MAQIFPFRALRYNPERVRLSDVVTQPYDKITPAMQEKYYAASAHNLVRIILGKAEPSEGEGNGVYARAAKAFSEWRRQDIFVQEEQPSLYPYLQKFVSPAGDGRVYERRGFIGLGQIEDYDAGIIFRHENTLSAPKADRLKLLRATRAHFGQIFMLYADPEKAIDALVWANPGSPLIEVTDENGVQHVVHKASERSIVSQVQALMHDHKLIIADGHHRYETALNYRNERRNDDAARHDIGGQPYERVMMTFVNISGNGLLVLPTHRVVFGLEHFDVAGVVDRWRRFFTVNPLRERVTAASAMQLLTHPSRENTTFLAVTPPGDFVLEARPEAELAPALAAVSARQRQLDVVKLHSLVLNQALGISDHDIQTQKHVQYFRDAAEAIQRVRDGANAAFLTNPVTVDQVRDIALAGEVMPQKSTDFYPKLLSGLTIYALE
jgi:uncharacterized protein (DUF1015 family)